MATTYRGEAINSTQKTCEKNTYTIKAQEDRHTTLNSNADSIGYFWCDTVANPNAYKKALETLSASAFLGALSVVLSVLALAFY